MGNVQPNTAYSTAYSSPLSWILVSFTAFVSLPICILVHKRRNSYPINGSPCFFPLLSLIGCPLGVYGFVSLYLGELPDCWARKIGAVTGYSPAPTSVMVQMLYVYFGYKIQLERKLPASQRSYSTKLISFPYLCFYHFLLMLAFALPATISPFLFREEDPLTGDCVLKADSGSKMGNMLLDLIVKLLCIIFATRLAVLLKPIEEAFNFKASAKGAARVTIYCSLPMAVADIVAGMFLPRAITIHISFVNRVSWCFVFINHLYYAGVVPLKISYREEAHRRRIQESKSRRSSRVINYAHNVSELHNILFDPERASMREEFALYLMKEFCLENMLFVEKVRGLKRSLGLLIDRSSLLQSNHSALITVEETHDQTLEEPKPGSGKTGDIRKMPEVLQEISSLLTQFLLPGSDTAINISDSLRRTLKGELEKALQSGDISPATKPLRDAEKQVLQIMMDPFNRFIKVFDDNSPNDESVKLSSSAAFNSESQSKTMSRGNQSEKGDESISRTHSLSVSGQQKASKKTFSIFLSTSRAAKHESLTTVNVRSAAGAHHHSSVDGSGGGSHSPTSPKVRPQNE